MEEELSVATSSSLSLLAAMYSPPAVIVADASLAAHIPALWPFLSHSLTSVRLAAATCLARLVAAGDAAAMAAAAAAAATGNVEALNAAAASGDTVAWLVAASDAGSVAAAAAAAAGATAAPGGCPERGSWLQPVVGPCLQLLLQCLVMERAEPVRQVLLQAWRALLQHSRPADIAVSLSARDLRAMLSLLCTPCGQPLDTAALVVPLQGRLIPWSSPDAEAAGLVARPSKRARSDVTSSMPAGASGLKKPRGSQDSLGLPLQGSSQSLGGPGGAAGGGDGGCALDPEAWPGISEQQGAVCMRLLVSRALAELCDTLTGQVRLRLG